MSSFLSKWNSALKSCRHARMNASERVPHEHKEYDFVKKNTGRAQMLGRRRQVSGDYRSTHDNMPADSKWHRTYVDNRGGYRRGYPTS